MTIHWVKVQTPQREILFLRDNPVLFVRHPGKDARRGRRVNEIEMALLREIFSLREKLAVYEYAAEQAIALDGVPRRE